MAARRRVPLVVLSAALLLIAAAVALTWSSPGAQAGRERAARIAAAGSGGAADLPSRAGLTWIDALRVESADAAVVVDIAVTLQPLRSVIVGAEVAGRVIEVGVEEHQPAEAGDLLVRLDPALPEAAVERARAGVVRALSASALATSEHGRQRNLSGQGIASKAEFDRSESEEQTRDAGVAEARAMLAEEQTRLDKTRILAPFAGVVSSFDLEPGAYLRVGDAVAELSDLSQIEIEVGVDDRQILALEVGAPVQVAVDAYPGEWFEGTIHALGRTPNSITRKYVVPVRVPNADGRLLPGMLGRVRFVLGQGVATLRIPRRAVYREFEVDYLYVLRHEAAAGGAEEIVAEVERRRVGVHPVAFRPDLLDVDFGLASGDWIAVSGIRELRNGVSVRVREQPAIWSTR